MGVFNLTKEDWYSIAFRIDGEFSGSQKTFSAGHNQGYFLLDSNRCDWSSLIRVYYDDNFNISQITRLGDDTDGWKQIHENTMKSVNELLLTINK